MNPPSCPLTSAQIHPTPKPEPPPAPPTPFRHPGGLVDEEAGKRELVVDVNDNLMATSATRTVPRSDLARVCIAALFEEKAKVCGFVDEESNTTCDDCRMPLLATACHCLPPPAAAYHCLPPARASFLNTIPRRRHLIGDQAGP